MDSRRFLKLWLCPMRFQGNMSSTIEIPASDTELLSRAKRHITGFAKLLENSDADASTTERVRVICRSLAREQRGYRDKSQIEKIVYQLDISDDVDDVERIVSETCVHEDALLHYDISPHQLTNLPLSVRRQAARSRDLNWPTREEIQDQIQELTFSTMGNEEEIVLVAPTSSGKTKISVEEEWSAMPTVTGDEPVVLFTETTEARDEAVDRAEENGLDVEVLLGYADACPVAAGDYDPENIDENTDREPVFIEGLPAGEWFKFQADDKGRSATELHREAAEIIDGDLPCCEDEKCTLLTQWQKVPRDEEENVVYDLIIATDSFAHVPTLRHEVNVIHDEQPTYTVNFEQERIQKMVSAYLTSVGSPVKTWEEFVSTARNNPESERAKNIQHSLRSQPLDKWLHRNGAHTIAPNLTKALWKALTTEPDQNGRSAATYEYIEEPLYRSTDENEITNKKSLSIVIDRNNTVRSIRHVPDFSACRSITGLDAWPALPLWRRNVSDDIEIESVVDSDERRLWRIFERGLTVIQVGNATRPNSQGNNFDKQHARIILEYLHHLYPESFRTAGTPSNIEDRVQRLMNNIGIENSAVMHLGEQKSRNDFKSEVVGLLYECIDPGDDYVLDVLAECEYDARPEYRGLDVPCDKCNTDGECERCLCEDCEGKGCSECHETGHQRAFGRGFVGQDSDKATEILESVREHNCAQMVGRWGRDKDIEAAVVYTCTDALPCQLVDREVPGVQWKYTDMQAAVVEQLIDHGRATIKQILQEIETEESGKSGEVDTITREAIWKTLSGTGNNLMDYNKVSKYEGDGAYGADIYEWQDKGLTGLHGIADLGERVPVNEYV